MNKRQESVGSRQELHKLNPYTYNLIGEWVLIKNPIDRRKGYVPALIIDQDDSFDVRWNGITWIVNYVYLQEKTLCDLAPWRENITEQ